MNKICLVAAMMSATSATAGGWEASRLDTSFMYQKGNYGEVSYAPITYDVTGSAFNGATHVNRKTAKNQTRAAVSFKTSYEDFDVGLTRFNSATIQMSGGAATFGTGGTWVPDADMPQTTTSLIGKYGVSDNLGILLGVNRNTLAKSFVTTIVGRYDIDAASSTGTVMGVVYSKPEIALRVELLSQPKSTLTSNTKLTISTVGAATPYNGANVASFNSKASLPDRLTLNFQSGIAEDTLLYGSIHQAKWATAQITVPTGLATTSVSSSFTDTTDYSLGVARKMSDSLVVTGSLNHASGSGKTGTSLFTMSNGHIGASLGARYTFDKFTVSGGYSFTRIGGVKITPAGQSNYANYSGNSVSAFALKIGVSF